MEKVSLKKKKQIAEKLYVYNEVSQKEIAEDLGLTEKTVSKWKTEGKWEEIKAAHTTGTDQIIKALLQETLAITEEAKKDKRRMTPKEVDAIVKNAKAIKMLAKDVNLVTVIMVFKQFNKYLVELNPDLAKALTEFQRRFIYSINAEE